MKRGFKSQLIFFHDCNDCEHYHDCDEEKTTSTDCKKFQYREGL